MKNKSIIYGSVAGAVTVVFFLIIYLIDKKLLLNPWVAYSPMLVYVAAMYLASSRVREEIEGPFPWKEALRIAFIVFLIASAWFYLFYYVIHLADPSLAVLQKEYARENLSRFIEPGKLQEAYRKLEEQDFQMTLGRAILGWAQGSILGFGLAALIALVTRRESKA